MSSEVFIGNLIRYIKKGVPQVGLNGEPSYIWRVLAGNCPYKRVVNKKYANNFLGVEEGKTYLLRVVEEPEDEFGRVYNWTMLKELSIDDLTGDLSKFGPPFIIPERDGRGETTNEATIPAVETAPSVEVEEIEETEVEEFA